jgi:hypothetical protein
MKPWMLWLAAIISITICARIVIWLWRYLDLRPPICGVEDWNKDKDDNVG